MKRGTSNQSNPETHYMDCEAGRRLAWSEFGDLRGRVVLYFHGFPGSRLEVSLIQHVAARLCIRLVVPDRPGIGASDFQPARHIQDWPADVEALADKLRLERFHLLGVSGGGPYALATALAIPQRLYGVSIVSGVGETTSSGALDGMNPLATRFIRFNQRMPGVARWTLTHLLGPLLKAAPALVLKILAGSAPEADMKVLNQPAVRGITLMSVCEAMRQGPKGVVQELALISRPWGFDPGNIRVPLQLWHGEADITVPVSMGRRHAQQIPGCDAYFLPGEGHFSVLIGYIQDILKLLLKLG
jgi:pimeloyl-ACP methyl ester carboxylesterase